MREIFGVLVQERILVTNIDLTYYWKIPLFKDFVVYFLSINKKKIYKYKYTQSEKPAYIFYAFRPFIYATTVFERIFVQFFENDTVSVFV